LNQVAGISDARCRILEGLSVMGVAVHEVHAPGGEMEYGFLSVSPAYFQRGDLIAWESPARLRV
jgi:hypothetical protein